MFVAKAGLHVYTFRDAWAQPTARREMWEGFVNNPQLGSSIYSSQLPVNAKDLQPVVLQAVTDFVASFQVAILCTPWHALHYMLCSTCRPWLQHIQLTHYFEMPKQQL